MNEKSLSGQPLSAGDSACFRRIGVIGPFSVLDSDECAVVFEHYTGGSLNPAVWWKGLAVNDRRIFEIATRSEIVSRVCSLLGDDVVLWGAQFVHRVPDQEHAWHSDIETVLAPRKFVSVWVGVNNTSFDSGLKFVAGTHLSEVSIQQVAAERGLERHGMANERIVEIAAEYTRRPTVVQPNVLDGQAVFFSGGIWHASLNSTPNARTALLLQYATPDVPLLVIDHTQLGWPFEFTDTRIPCVLVSGTARDSPQDLRDAPIG